MTLSSSPDAAVVEFHILIRSWPRWKPPCLQDRGGQCNKSVPVLCEQHSGIKEVPSRKALERLNGIWGSIQSSAVCPVSQLASPEFLGTLSTESCFIDF